MELLALLKDIGRSLWLGCLLASNQIQEKKKNQKGGIPTSNSRVVTKHLCLNSNLTHTPPCSGGPRAVYSSSSYPSSSSSSYSAPPGREPPWRADLSPFNFQHSTEWVTQAFFMAMPEPTTAAADLLNWIDQDFTLHLSVLIEALQRKIVTITKPLLLLRLRHGPFSYCILGAP